MFIKEWIIDKWLHIKYVSYYLILFLTLRAKNKKKVFMMSISKFVDLNDYKKYVPVVSIEILHIK